jgi:hypothetical protein
MSNADFVVTPEGRLSYPYLYEPQEPNFAGGEAKYSAVIVFEEGTDLSALEDMVTEAIKAKAGDKGVKDYKAGKIRSPFRSTDGRDYPAGYDTFITARSSAKYPAPSLFEAFMDPRTNEPMQPTKESMYPGCRVRLLVGCYYYDTNGNRGVSFSLRAVQRVGDADRFAGGPNAAEVFSFEKPTEADLERLASDTGDDSLESFL